MTVVELSHHWLEQRIQAFELIRDFRAWRAYSGHDYYIIIDDFGRQRAIVFIYKLRKDRDADVEALRRLADDGEEAAGVPAWLTPTPPTRSASAANPLPDEPAA